MKTSILDYQLIKQIFLAKESNFSMLKNVINVGTQDEPAYFVDNGSSILGVAHLDSVVYGDCQIVEPTEGCPMLVSPMCDDRLGVATLLAVLPKTGIKTDWLLTTNEETMQSTSRFFKPKKQYNWMYMFDRASNDVVTYQYEGSEWLASLRKNKFKIGNGTYSDIADMNQLGCMGVNIGTGYYHQHTRYSYAIVNEWLMQVSLFASFYHANKDIYYKYIPEMCVKCGAVLGRYDYGKMCVNCEPKYTRIYAANDYGNFDWAKWTQDINKTIRGDNITEVTKARWFCHICGLIQNTTEEKTFLNSHEGLCAYCYDEYRCRGCGRNPQNPSDYQSIADYDYCTSCSQAQEDQKHDNVGI
jgi:hypothetical protein